MPTLEKRAWFSLGIVAMASAAYLILGAFVGFGMVANSAFFLLALTAGLPRKQVVIDERDREILNRSLLIGLRAFWIVFVGAFVILGAAKGWDSVLRVPMWALATLIWGSWIVVSAARSITTILLYRSGR